ncbi:hypothetical protein N9H34_01515 [bacterium]|nr:hypothetical protein [bacterium]
MKKDMKKCSGCQEDLPLTSFYKNKRMNDGHSIYCVSCTKENSRKYHQRKKNRIKVSHNEEVVKNMVLNNLISDHVNPNAEVIMKLMLVERTLKTALDEIDEIKLSVSTQLPSTIS